MTAPLAPFFFAYVDADQTTFTSDMHVVDEDIFSLEMKHEEGQVATLTLTILNPRIGLLNPTRKIWAWMARRKQDGTIVPFFFGVLVGIPSNLFGETLQLKFIAQPLSFIFDKQAVAETLKVRPYYDPVWIEETKRDDPDTVLEARSALWHVDRTTLEITASDVLVGEDGTIDFGVTPFYPSVNMQLGQPPLATVVLYATVNWTQRMVGYIPGPGVNIQSYTGETFLADWPKPGAGLGGGWFVHDSFVNDVYKVQQTPTASSSSTWTNNDPEAGDGSTASMSNSGSYPALLAPNPITGLLTASSQSGICDPDADPPVNRPSSVSVTGIVVPLWALNCSWTFRYEPKREFSELLYFTMTANTQAVLTSPVAQQNSETITISGSNVGLPLITLDAWSDFKNLPVQVGQTIFPNDPTAIGGVTYQICVVAGTAGATQPHFSTIPGTTVTDGTVTWASLGTSPLTQQPNWSDSQFVPIGEIIYYVPKIFDADSGNWQEAAVGTYLICKQGGQTNTVTQMFTYTPVVHDNDAAIPGPVTVSFIPGPSFAGGWQYPGTHSGGGGGDGTVEWLDLGNNPTLLGIPIGGTPLNVTARHYFPTDRGLWSIEYLLCKARARLRLRARAVTVSFEAPFDSGLGLSCRKNASISDPRIPGGTATGKVIAYTLSAEGGKEMVSVQIGCGVGFGGTVAGNAGTPDYVDDDYVDSDYQVYNGMTTVVAEDDIGYTPPTFAPFDDGIVFPLQSIPGINTATISGSPSEQAVKINAAIPVTSMLDSLGLGGALSATSGSSDSNIQLSGTSPDGAWWLHDQQLLFQTQTVPYVMEASPVRYDVYLKPLTNGPFSGAYGLEVSMLEIPQGIDLEADSEV